MGEPCAEWEWESLVGDDEGEEWACELGGTSAAPGPVGSGGGGGLMEGAVRCARVGDCRVVES